MRQKLNVEYNIFWSLSYLIRNWGSKVWNVYSLLKNNEYYVNVKQEAAVI